jgi:TPR repeat protein
MDLAEKGHAYSEYCLGARYRDGFGVPKDLAKAREWLEKAASQGLGSAKIELHALLRRWDPEAQQAFDRPS